MLLAQPYTHVICYCKAVPPAAELVILRLSTREDVMKCDNAVPLSFSFGQQNKFQYFTVGKRQLNRELKCIQPLIKQAKKFKQSLHDASRLSNAQILQNSNFTSYVIQAAEIQNQVLIRSLAAKVALQARNSTTQQGVVEDEVDGMQHEGNIALPYYTSENKMLTVQNICTVKQEESIYSQKFISPDDTLQWQSLVEANHNANLGPSNAMSTTTNLNYQTCTVCNGIMDIPMALTENAVQTPAIKFECTEVVQADVDFNLPRCEV